MQILQGTIKNIDFRIENAVSPYNDRQVLKDNLYTDYTEWTQLSVAPFFYPDGQNIPMDGKLVGKWQGDGEDLSIYTTTMEIPQNTSVKIKTHNPLQFAIVIHCITEYYTGTEWVQIEDDRRVLGAGQTYEGTYKDFTGELGYRFGIVLKDSEQYHNTLYGVSQFVVYTGTLISNTITECKINEECDYFTYKSNRIDLMGIGACGINKREPFTAYDDEGRSYGEWFAYSIVNYYNGTWSLTGYDRSYKLANRVSRGDWFEGHTSLDAVKNIYTYTEEYEWQTDTGEEELNTFLNVDDTYPITGLIPWEFNLRQAVQQVALSLGCYPITDRTGKLIFKSLSIPGQVDHNITYAEEVFGRKVSENDKAVDRVLIRDYTVKWENGDSSDNYIRKYKYDSYAERFNEAYLQGDTLRVWNEADSEFYWKYYTKENGTWRNNRFITASSPDGFEMSLDGCPSKRPSDSQHTYFKQVAEWTGGTNLILSGNKYTEGAIQDIWTAWFAYPKWLDESTQFYIDANTLEVEMRLTTSVVTMEQMSYIIFTNMNSRYYVNTQLLPNYDIQLGDIVSLGGGEHTGRVMSITTDLTKGGLIDIELECHTPTN